MDYLQSAVKLIPAWLTLDFVITVYKVCAFVTAYCMVQNSKIKRDFRLQKKPKRELTADEEQRMIEKFERGDAEGVQFVTEAFYDHLEAKEEEFISRDIFLHSNNWCTWEDLIAQELFPHSDNNCCKWDLCDCCRQEIYTSTMSSSKTVESYVAEIIAKIKDADYPYLDTFYDTLQKMRSSGKQKHEDNYWKVLQCLGETGSDMIIRSLSLCERASCKCHINRNLYVLMQLFVEMQSSVAVIKHINLYKDKVVSVLFKAVRQREIPELSRKGFVSLYRCLLVGKFSMVELYLRHNIFRDIQEHIKCRLQFYSIPSIEAIQYCAKILHVMALLGGTNTQRRIKSSQALKLLMEYAKTFNPNHPQMEKNYIWCYHKEELFLHFNSLIEILFEESQENLKDSWHPKDKLSEDLSDEASYFCSCPSCRKQCCDKDKFLYCGACKLSRYCSEKCQKEHWKNGHKSTCLSDHLQEKDFKSF
ncbi:uncharacterized protein LOC143048553 [Mytilus galloprovincialis]|uniref:uncharacterized protein LOC143048553 n=1 Tax=Mytilus galloprovincialis TaxID=29158 RepID=UPI003F7B59AC